MDVTSVKGVSRNEVQRPIIRRLRKEYVRDWKIIIAITPINTFFIGKCGFQMTEPTAGVYSRC